MDGTNVHQLKNDSAPPPARPVARPAPVAPVAPRPVPVARPRSRPPAAVRADGAAVHRRFWFSRTHALAGALRPPCTLHALERGLCHRRSNSGFATARSTAVRGPIDGLRTRVCVGRARRPRESPRRALVGGRGPRTGHAAPPRSFEVTHSWAATAARHRAPRPVRPARPELNGAFAILVGPPRAPRGRAESFATDASVAKRDRHKSKAGSCQKPGKGLLVLSRGASTDGAAVEGHGQEERAAGQYQGRRQRPEGGAPRRARQVLAGVVLWPPGSPSTVSSRRKFGACVSAPRAQVLKFPEAVQHRVCDLLCDLRLAVRGSGVASRCRFRPILARP